LTPAIARSLKIGLLSSRLGHEPRSCLSRPALDLGRIKLLGYKFMPLVQQR
jgi:hypothetical protein